MSIILNFPYGNSSNSISTIGSVIEMTFDKNFIGEKYIVTDGKDEIIKKIVPINGEDKIIVENCNTQYTFSCVNNNGEEFKCTFTTGDYYSKIQMNISIPHIYGISWNGSTSSPIIVRTDEASDFSICTPYYNGISEASSPFDNLMPWNGMKIEKNRAGGDMVKIPKFWYKLTPHSEDTGFTIQIADNYIEGFNVSPAHMPRTDNDIERDFVYIGRYHCDSTYKSRSGQIPINSITKSVARTNIAALGSNIYQCDFAMRFTIWLLYLVEFANWNSQQAIGYGCGSNSSVGVMGYTDSMPYHTGTTKNSRTTYGFGTQYRYIEGLWDNVEDWCDGCYYNSNGFYLILDPRDFTDNSGGLEVGGTHPGSSSSVCYPSKFEIKTNGPYPIFSATALSTSSSSFCDGWRKYNSYPNIFMGGYYINSTQLGLFNVDGTSTTGMGAYIGCRLMEIPNLS